MTHWGEYSEADFDARRAPRGAVKRAAEAAAAGQDGLFFVATPVRDPGPAPAREEMPGQPDLFAEDGPGSPSARGHEIDPDPGHGAFDVCLHCQLPIHNYPGTARLVAMAGASAECYGRKS